jgi:hypothetical protein
MSLLGRFFAVPIGLFVAFAAAGIILAIGVMAPDMIFGGESDPRDHAIFVMVMFFATGMAVTLSLFPAFVLVLLAEIFAVRSVLVYAAFGAVVGFLAYYGVDFAARFENATDMTPIPRLLELVVASGIVAGLVYWAIAGRNAGGWRAPG